jgi:hypothetical protein
MNLKYRRIAIGFILFCVFTASLADGLFVFLHAGHDHTGESCPVCAQMKSASDALRRLLEGSLKPAGPADPAILSFSAPSFLLKFSENIKRQTLITAKVRLND